MDLSRFHITQGEVKTEKGFCGTIFILVVVFFFKVRETSSWLDIVLQDTHCGLFSEATFPVHGPSLVGKLDGLWCHSQITIPSSRHTARWKTHSAPSIPQSQERNLGAVYSPFLSFFFRIALTFILSTQMVTVAVLLPDT